MNHRANIRLSGDAVINTGSERGEKKKEKKPLLPFHINPVIFFFVLCSVGNGIDLQSMLKKKY